MTTNTQVFLNDLIAKNIIKETDGTRKLTIQGVTKNYKVYRIPPEYLHYNIKNGRIISSINRYEAEGNVLNLTDKVAYNNILQQYIVESNSVALQSTKANIKLFGQRLPGVVLNDGRVIDGNRRFTCIRLINAEDGANLYFEAVILDQAEGLTDKDIKRLELNLQHAEERPVDYDPIDNLVEVYTVIVKDKLFTVEDYARNTNKRKSEVEKMVKKAILMAEFLEFINAKDKYYVARDLNLDGPLQEVMGILNKEDSSDEVEFLRVKNALFTALAIPYRGDTTRYIRDIGKDILSADNREEFLEEYEDIVEDVYETFQEEENVTKEVIRKVNADLESKKKSESIIEDKITTTRITNIQGKPVDSLKRSITTLESIDTDQISRLDATSKQEFKSLMDNINATMKLFGEKLGI
ncbi:hypothetical protein [Solibacillus isronensis]|uniref:hypothetical protein n=1 Tax=Solibacillus isronensis TaxID=412383 RepID=UPI00203B5290|nr:hypothetical protein [Solibacillus isronensis]MCM3723969.1 hypothetical protein [Solibacillus isronensis]